MPAASLAVADKRAPLRPRRKARVGECFTIVNQADELVFLSDNQGWEKEEIYFSLTTTLLCLEDEIPDYIRQQYEINLRLHQFRILYQDGRLLIKFRYENDRTDLIPLAAFANTRVTIRLYEIGWWEFALPANWRVYFVTRTTLITKLCWHVFCIKVIF